MIILGFLFICIFGGLLLINRAPAAGGLALLVGGFCTWALIHGMYYPAPATTDKQLWEQRVAAMPPEKQAAERKWTAKPWCTDAQVAQIVARRPELAEVAETHDLLGFDEKLGLPCK